MAKSVVPKQNPCNQKSHVQLLHRITASHVETALLDNESTIPMVQKRANRFQQLQMCTAVVPDNQPCFFFKSSKYDRWISILNGIITYILNERLKILISSLHTNSILFYFISFQMLYFLRLFKKLSAIDGHLMLQFCWQCLMSKSAYITIITRMVCERYSSLVNLPHLFKWRQYQS